MSFVDIFWILTGALDFVITWVMIKILMSDKKVTLREVGMGLALALTFGIAHYFITIWAAPLIYIPALIFLTCYIKKYNLKKAIILTSLGMFVQLVIPVVTFAIFLELIGPYFLFELYHFLYYTPANLLLGFLVVFLIKMTTGKVRRFINQNENLQTAIMWICLLILVPFYGVTIWRVHLGNTNAFILTQMAFLVLYLVISFIGFYFYSKSIREKHEIQRKEVEQKSLQLYTAEIEKHYSSMRQFKHDYQNILSSLDDYVKNKDYAGLEGYYREKIRPASLVMDKHLFELEPLGNIKIQEIKSIFSLKLMRAQELGIEIVFEAKEEINRLSTDSVVLVRSLGILLDNAIEELMTLGRGVLHVAVIKRNKSVMFVIANTCREDIERIHQLKQPGFSTKGDGRGIGLSNLAQFAKENGTMRVETSIEGERFVQKVIDKEI